MSGESGGIRAALGRPAVGLTIAGVMIGLTVLVFLIQRRSEAVPGHGETRIFLVDLSTDPPAESVGSSFNPPPLLNASGQPAIVEAVYYSFDGGKTRRLAYYQKYTDEAKKAFVTLQQNPLAGRNGDLQRAMEAGTFIRDPALKTADVNEGWVPADSPEAASINVRAARPPAAGGSLSILRPQ
jgi:hypothetical protein